MNETLLIVINLIEDANFFVLIFANQYFRKNLSAIFYIVLIEKDANALSSNIT